MRNKNPVNAVVVRGLGLIHEAIGLERSFGMEAVCCGNSYSHLARNDAGEHLGNGAKNRQLRRRKIMS